MSRSCSRVRPCVSSVDVGAWVTSRGVLVDPAPHRKLLFSTSLSIAELLVDASLFIAAHWPSLLGIAAAFALRKRVPPLPLPRLADWQACALIVAVSPASAPAPGAPPGGAPPEDHGDDGDLLGAHTG